MATVTTRRRGRPPGGGLTRAEIREKKRLSDKKRNKEKVYIGEHYVRWCALREELKLTFNYEVAGILLDRFVISVINIMSGIPPLKITKWW
jgi:hypothetical protein